MSDCAPGDVTQLLTQWRSGDRTALDRLMPLVYDELRVIAARYLRKERSGHTLQSTALANEAFIHLVDSHADWQNRAHFFAVAARIIRGLLVDHARARLASKRGGANLALSLDEAIAVPLNREFHIIAVDDALTSLSRMDEQQGRIVELRFFGGLTIEETSEVLQISPSTVKRDWILAKTWILRELSSSQPPPQLLT
jgi:RNA polymerase sigma factor (TIGR02999 family)